MTFSGIAPIARSVAGALSRRALLATIAGGMLGLVSRVDEAGSEVEAERRQRRARKRKRRQRHCPSHRRCPTRCCRRGQTCQQDRCRRRPSPPAPVDTRVRRNLHALDPSGPELSSFARGVAAMRQRGESDRTSWASQVRLHQAAGQHASIHFLAWHRMYLYWFERILRQASGDPAFALPYWDLSNPQQRVLPHPFRDATNALYEADRSDMVNGGLSPGPDDEWRFRIAETMATIDFEDTGSGPSFGGGPGIVGAVERSPHDYIHNWVGGKMSRLPEAPGDPVFWIHHANIDRLWERWLRLGGGRANPTSGPFVSTTFTFYDEHGAEVRMTGREILDTVGDLGYRYDDVAEYAGAGASATSAGPPMTATERSTTIVGATAKGDGLTLGRRPVTVPVAVRAAAGTTFRAARRGSGARTTLTLQGVAGGGVAGVSHAVHVGAASDNPSPRARSFVGVISLFGLQPWDHQGHGGHRAATMRFDATDAVSVAGDERAITVSLVPISLTGSDTLPGGTWLTIERIVIAVDGGRPKATRKTSSPRQKRQRPRDGRHQPKRLDRKARPKARPKDDRPQRDGSKRPGNTTRPTNPKRRRHPQRSPTRAAHRHHAPEIPGGKLPTHLRNPAEVAAEPVSTGHAHH